MAGIVPSLTVEAVAGISAFIQELEIRAAGGEPVNEETLALRMLASASTDPGYDLSSIRSLTTGGAPITASADSDGKFEALTSLLMGDITSVKQQVAAGLIPKAPAISVLPRDINEEIQRNYASVQDATSLCQLYSNLMQVQQQPQGFNIMTEAAAALNFQAKTAFDAMMGPMAGYYNFGSTTQREHNDSVSMAQVHPTFLRLVFDGFDFDDKTKQALDSQLTTFTRGLAQINTENSPNSTMDFMLRLNVVPKVKVTGDSNDRDGDIYVPTTFLIHLKIDARSFSRTVRKPNTGQIVTLENVEFKLDLTVTKCTLNVRKFEENRERFDRLFQLLTDQSLRSYSDLFNKRINSTEANPGEKM